MKASSQHRINTVKKAGNILIKKAEFQQTRDQAENHKQIGEFLVEHPEEILKFILRKNRSWK